MDDLGLPGDLKRWRAAFPAALRGDVAAAFAALPASSVVKPAGSRLTSFSTDSSRHPVGITVDGESILIPARMYVDALKPSELPDDLTDRQRNVMACMYTRHHIGYVRQRWARLLVASDQAFVIPFVVQLLGEYVVEIITDLCLALTDLDDPTLVSAQPYGRFLAENPGYFGLTRQRVASYWDCYHRGRYLRPADYPGHVLLTRLDRLLAASR